VADPGFQYTVWALRFPSLAQTTPQALATYLYAEALMLPDCNRVINDTTLASSQQIVVMNLAVAHLAFLAQRDGGAAGRISGATEGSVSVAFEYPTRGTTEAWWGQTTYGQEFWRILAPYRTAQYAVGPGASCPNIGPQLYSGPQVIPGFGYGGFGGPWRGNN
jgi:hypothetical protein